MNKFIIASCLIALTFGVTVNPSNSCSCSDYHLSNECSSLNGCYWNATGTGTCQKPSCSSFTSSASCLLYSQCQWVNNACASFSSCSSLKGNSLANCSGQNAACYWTTGESCVDYSCSLFNSTTNCTAPSCLYSGTSCAAVSSCSSLNTSVCANYGCLVNGQSCSPYVCANFTAEPSCILAAASKTSATPCLWSNNTCVDLSSFSNLTSTTCYTHTAGAYHWSSSNTTDGSCTACYGLLIQIVFALILLLA